jgi:hypothetical protein
MKKRFLFGSLGAIAAYVVAAIAAYFIVGQFSANMHDRALEAAMSAAFFYGPAGALAGFALGWARGGAGRRRAV